MSRFIEPDLFHRAYDVTKVCHGISQAAFECAFMSNVLPLVDLQVWNPQVPSDLQSYHHVGDILRAAISDSMTTESAGDIIPMLRWITR